MTEAELQKNQQQRREDAISAARSDIQHLQALKESEAYQWLCEVLRKRADTMANDILHLNELTAEKREELRRERLGILTALAAPAEIEASQRSTLAKLNADSSG